MTLNKVNLDQARAGSYYTILGAEDPAEFVRLYTEKLIEFNIGKPKEWFHASGAEVNKHFGFTGDNAFQDDLNILFFPLDGMNAGRLAMFKLRMQDRWFDDVVDNTLRKMNKLEEPEDEMSSEMD